MIAKHEDLIEEEKLQCDTCGKTFLSRTIVKRHKLYMHKCGMKFGCDKCGQGFVSEKSRSKHVCIKAEKERKHVCKLCKHVFSFQSAHSRHNRCHRERAPIKCALCSCQFINDRDRLAHIKIQHSWE